MRHGKTHYGYKSHISIDRKHKVIRNTPSHQQKFTIARSSRNCWMRTIWQCLADPAYRSVERKAALPGAHYRSHIHCKSIRKRRLNERERKSKPKNDQEFGLELSTCLPSRLIDWCGWQDEARYGYGCCQKNEREDTGLSLICWRLLAFVGFLEVLSTTNQENVLA